MNKAPEEKEKPRAKLDFGGIDNPKERVAPSEEEIKASLKGTPFEENNAGVDEGGIKEEPWVRKKDRSQNVNQFTTRTSNETMKKFYEVIEKEDFKVVDGFKIAVDLLHEKFCGIKK